jgi:hypothetical protein
MQTLSKAILLAFLLSLSMVSFMSPVPSAYAADCTAVQSGDWNDPATWDSSGCDHYIIPEDITVTITPATTGLSFVVNYGTIINNSNINFNSVWEIANHGSFINNNTLTVDYFYNYGSLTNSQGVYLSIYDYFSNSGNFDNYGIMSIHPWKNWGNNQTGILNNYGSIDNNGSGSNHGTFNNHGGISNNGYDTAFKNFGLFYNDGSFGNAGEMDNSGTFYNNGSFHNRYKLFNSNTFYNNGTFRNYCDGVLTGNPLIGNPIVYDFVAVAPTLIDPTHRTRTTDTTPTFSWGSVTGAESYRLMIYLEDRSFEYKKRTFNTSYTLASGEALTPNKYFWRVRTQDAACSTWTGWSGRNTLFVD